MAAAQQCSLASMKLHCRRRIDWTKFTKIGTIEVRNGGTLCGHLQVVSAKNNSGRNWLVKVKALDIVSNEIEPDSGHPCYFWGMFTE